ncbi:transposase [Bradyrhizobium niftali]|uniref:transposase n=1 Tax=Bradyrhizobium niftali TaxID=2560055 RepID=UPI00384CB124
MTTITVLSGPERRRRWTTAENLRIVEESLAPGASVVEIARRHDVHRNLVTAWRRQARTGVLAFEPGRCSDKLTKSVLRRSPLRQTANVDGTLRDLRRDRDRVRGWGSDADHGRG